MSNPLEDAKLFKKVDVSSERIARVYAESLFKAAGSEAESVGEELHDLVFDTFRKLPDLYAFFSSGTFANGAKRDLIEKNFQGNASDTLINFLQILNNHDRLELLPAVATSFRELVDKKNKRVPVFVTSAVALDDGQREALKKQLNNLFHVEPMLEERIDPELLGGLIIRVGDWQFDGTVKARLNQLKNQLLERSSHEIQGGRDRFCTV
ncbi:MAG TPA: ATP synthase F1 subunit delta [Gemmatales bacterium]|nr:ATP synthase F1 subunit delta [Gemmatales bacterium]